MTKKDVEDLKSQARIVMERRQAMLEAQDRKRCDFQNCDQMFSQSAQSLGYSAEFIIELCDFALSNPTFTFDLYKKAFGHK